MRASAYPMMSMFLLVLLALPVLPACSEEEGASEPVISSRAYKGHENDLDMNYFVELHPKTVGTRLDDCQTCHKSFTFNSNGKKFNKNACDFCHLVGHPDEKGFDEEQPKSILDTLNPYGLAYKTQGRSKSALDAIAELDSDGDGSTNAAEIADLKYPGDPASKPGQQVAPLKSYTLEQIRALPAHTEFLLANSHKQQYDDYSSYQGVKFTTLLEHAGVNLADPKFEGITVIAPDGYLKSIPASKLTAALPAGQFHAGLDNATLGETCGFVKYPDVLPTGLTDGGEIPGEQWVMLAYARDGAAMDPSNLDVTSGKINGEGPYRLIVPQAFPGKPDRGSQYSPTNCKDGHDYDDNADHNAGDMVRGVVAIRVDPLPEGVEDFDYHNGGWAYIESAEVLLYGFGITQL